MHAAAIPCALWVVNQLNNNLDVIYALIVIVIIGVLHVQLGDDGVHPPCPVQWVVPSWLTNVDLA